MILTLDQQKLVEEVFTTAEKNLFERGTLSPVALLVGMGGMHMVPLKMADTREKLVSAKVVNIMAGMLKADLVIWITEAWFAKDKVLDEKGDIIPPSEREDRVESLMAVVAVPTGDVEMLSAPIKRTPDGKPYCEGREWMDDDFYRSTRLLAPWALDS